VAIRADERNNPAIKNTLVKRDMEGFIMVLSGEIDFFKATSNP